jgi:lysozyme
MTIVEQLTRDEGVRLFPYIDSVGKTTIGVGRNLTDVGISRDEADYLLSNDIARATTELAASLPWTASLNDARRGALINLLFNLGLHGLLSFKNMLASLENGNPTDAAKHLLDSNYATQVGARAHRLAQQLETGEWV